MDSNRRHGGLGLSGVSRNTWNVNAGASAFNVTQFNKRIGPGNGARGDGSRHFLSTRSCFLDSDRATRVRRSGRHENASPPPSAVAPSSSGPDDRPPACRRIVPAAFISTTISRVAPVSQHNNLPQQRRTASCQPLGFVDCAFMLYLESMVVSLSSTCFRPSTFGCLECETVVVDDN